MGTPNGQKIPPLLELLGVKYQIEQIDIRTNEQKKPYYLEMNPNGRIPTLVDKSTGITISESAAILTYLADTYDKERKFSYEYKTKEYYKQLELLYFQMAGIGPMQGQANHFILFAPESIPYGQKRYNEETKRLYGVLEEYLKRNEASGFLVGDHISIADIVMLPWTFGLEKVNVDIEQFPLVKQWVRKLVSIPEVKKGLYAHGTPYFWPKYLEDL